MQLRALALLSVHTLLLLFVYRISGFEDVIIVDVNYVPSCIHCFLVHVFSV